MSVGREIDVSFAPIDAHRFRVVAVTRVDGRLAARALLTGNHVGDLVVGMQDGRDPREVLDAEVDRWGSTLGWQLLFLASILTLIAFPKRLSWTPALLLLFHTGLMGSTSGK